MRIKDSAWEMCGGDKEQETMTDATVMGDCVGAAHAHGSDSNFQVLKKNFAFPLRPSFFLLYLLFVINYALHTFWSTSLYLPVSVCPVPSLSEITVKHLSLSQPFSPSPSWRKISASAEFYLCNLYPLWQPSVPPYNPWLFTAGRPS